MAATDSKEKLSFEWPPSAFKSYVWDHFGFLSSTSDNGIRKLDKTVTVCRHCNMAVKYSMGCTSNMLTHLKRHHAAEFVSARAGDKKKTDDSAACARIAPGPPATGQLRLQDAFKKFMPHSSMRSIQITRAIGIFIATDLSPYAVTEKPGFRNMIALLEPRYRMPSRQHFSTSVIPELYEETKRSVLADMENTNCISVTTDGWTSRATESYVTITMITAHYITPAWEIKNPVLQTRRMIRVSHRCEYS